ncbi:16614_t:CDS:1, partial [Acaulospora morrowiae]
MRNKRDAAFIGSVIGPILPIIIYFNRPLGIKITIVIQALGVVSTISGEYRDSDRLRNLALILNIVGSIGELFGRTKLNYSKKKSWYGLGF